MTSTNHLPSFSFLPSLIHNLSFSYNYNSRSRSCSQIQLQSFKQAISKSPLPSQTTLLKPHLSHHLHHHHYHQPCHHLYQTTTDKHHSQLTHQTIHTRQSNHPLKTPQITNQIINRNVSYRHRPHPRRSHRDPSTQRGARYVSPQLYPSLTTPSNPYLTESTRLTFSRFHRLPMLHDVTAPLFTYPHSSATTAQPMSLPL